MHTPSDLELRLLLSYSYIIDGLAYLDQLAGDLALACLLIHPFLSSSKNNLGTKWEPDDGMRTCYGVLQVLYFLPLPDFRDDRLH